MRAVTVECDVGENAERIDELLPRVCCSLNDGPDTG